jgi:LPXTG-motif cell wall-anchored protein
MKKFKYAISALAGSTFALVSGSMAHAKYPVESESLTTLPSTGSSSFPTLIVAALVAGIGVAGIAIRKLIAR